MGLASTPAAFNLLALSFGGWFFLIVGGVFVLFWISIFIVSLAETRTVHEWEPAVGPREPGPYGQAMVAQAKSVGFIPGGTYAHRKFDLTATFLLSPDGTVAAGVYDGIMLKIPVK